MQHISGLYTAGTLPGMAVNIKGPMMQQETAKYETRLYKEGMAEPGTALLGTPGTNGLWNRDHPACKVLNSLPPGTEQKNTILYAKPAEPYATTIYHLSETAPNRVICPQDSETRMFLQDLPVAEKLDTESVALVLKDKKCVIVPHQGIIAKGGNPAEAYLDFSAACFAGFVKFFSDTLQAARAGELGKKRTQAFSRVCKQLPQPAVFETGLMTGPFETESTVKNAIAETGKKIVKRGLVNACFGNISYRRDDSLYISSSGSFLDELEDDLVMVNIKDGSCTGGKPSSELPTHLEIAASTDFRAVLHGHPLFTVIMSMDCREENCTHQGACHLDCPVPREISAIPIVPGETGGGAFGLNRTVPAAIKKAKAAIVYGHGVFTCASNDFNNALGRMITIERICRRIYFERMGNPHTS
ncbi:MAG: class II aldolase/adducin family protein [Desulfobacteraceae bacterium]|nr:class II aldolase/adducin family protein [Desulfobacteraceae bacterium]